MSDYRAAITEGLPTLKAGRIEFLAEGGNSVACRVNGHLLFLFPKTAQYAHKLLTQVKLLPALAPTLPLPVPNFQYVSYKPTSAFPYAFAGYKLIEGVSVVDCPVEIWDAEWWLQPFGEFVTALHRFPVEQAVGLGVAPFTWQGWHNLYHGHYAAEWWLQPFGEFVTALHRFPVEQAVGLGVAPFTWQGWHNLYHGHYATVRQAVYPLVTQAERAEIADYFEAFLTNPHHFEFEPVLLHGDFHLAHILLDLDKQLIKGVIDFGDCKIGDPALDVRNAWEPFYSGKRDATWLDRRLFYYRLVPLIKIVIGVGDENTAEVQAGLAEFRRKWAE